MRSRFLEEARLLRRVRSNNLVTVHDIGELDDGRPFFVMALADRGSVAQRLVGRRQRGVDVASLRTIVGALAAAIGAIHAEGFVHRDINPRNLLIQGKRRGDGERDGGAVTATVGGLLAADERVLVGDLGLAKDVVTLDASVSVLAGTPGYQAPEQVTPGMDIGPEADVFGATAVLWTLLTGEPPPSPGAVTRAVATLDPRWEPVIRRGLAADPEDRFGDIRAWERAVLDAVSSEPAAAELTPGMIPSDQCPYQGLAAFERTDADRFFGRDALVENLVQRLRTKRMLVVGGASGSGKSSAVRAGLVPAVATGSHPGSERWPILLFTPGADPLGELYYQLEKALSSVDTAPVPLADPDDPNRYRRLADRAAAPTGGLLICIDQFEELFTLGHGADVQAGFLEALSSLVDPGDSQTRLVIAVRADFYGTSSTFNWLAERITDNQVLVGPMSRIELRQAIELPAHRTGLRIEESLVETILADAGADAGSLPLVSHALAETWRGRRGSRLTLEAYAKVGGVAGAIGQTGEALYCDRFSADEQAAARRLLLRLVQPGDGVPDTRRSLPLASIDSDADPGTLQRVVDAFVEARLLSVDREQIQLAHEAIIRSWPRLRDWINASRDDIRMHRRIGHAAEEWDDGGRDPGLLYRGTPLAAAVEWATHHGGDLNTIEAAFLDAAVETERAAEDQVRLRAERARRNRRLAFSALTLLAIAATVALAFALVSRQQAEDAALAANERFAQALASQAEALADEDPRLANTLALESIARAEAPSVEARAVLVTTALGEAGSPLIPAVMPVSVGDALSVAITPDGSVAAVGLRDGSVQLWDRTGMPLGEPRRGHDGAIEEMTFTSDGSSLLTAGLDQRILQWDVRDPDTLPAPVQLADLGSLVWSVDIGPNGELAAATEDGIIRLWVDGASTPPLTLIDLARDFLTVSFSPAGDALLAGNGSGEVWGWSVPSGEQLFGPLAAHGSDVWEIVFTESGDAFATVSSDGRSRVFDLATLELVAEPFDDVTTAVHGVQIMDSMILAGDQTGRLWLSDLAGGQPVSTAVSHRDQIIDTAQALDGTLVTLGDDQRVRWWVEPTDTGPGFVTLPGPALGVAVSPDGRRMAVGGGDGLVRLYEPEAGNQPVAETTVGGAVWAVAFDADGTAVAAGDDAGTLVILGTDGRVGAVAPSAHDAVTDVVFSGGRVVTGGGDGFIRIWDPTDLTAPINELAGHAGGVTALAASPAAGRVAATDRAGTVRIWDVGSGELVDEWVADDNTIWGVGWSPVGDALATAHADEFVSIWTIGDRADPVVLTPQTGDATGVAFLGDGVSVATTSRDGSIRLWDRATGRQIGDVIDATDTERWSVAAAAHDTWFVTTATSGAVEIWRVLDVEEACSQLAWTESAQRAYLGAGEEPRACRR